MQGVGRGMAAEDVVEGELAGNVVKQEEELVRAGMELRECVGRESGEREANGGELSEAIKVLAAEQGVRVGVASAGGQSTTCLCIEGPASHPTCAESRRGARGRCCRRRTKRLESRSRRLFSRRVERARLSRDGWAARHQQRGHPIR